MGLFSNSCFNSEEWKCKLFNWLSLWKRNRVCCYFETSSVMKRPPAAREGDQSLNPVDSNRRISRKTRVSWLRAPFCQPFPTLIPSQRLYTPQDAPSGLGFIWPGSVNSGRIRTHAPGWMREAPEARSAPTRPLEGAWPRRTEAVTSHGQTWLWRLSKGASIGCSIKTSRI